MPDSHLIEDLGFDVEFDAEDDAIDGQSRLAHFARGEAMRIIDEVFEESQADAGGESLRIERLEVDLGSVAAGEMESQWSRRLRTRLRLALDEQRAAARAADVGGSAAAAQRRHQRRSRLEALLFFLRHGRLPWHASRAGDAHALQAWAEEALRDDAAALAGALRAMDDRTALARRLVRQFPAGWLHGLLRELMPAHRWRRLPPLAAPHSPREEAALVAWLCEAMAERDAGTEAMGPADTVAVGRAGATITAELAGVRARWEAALIAALAPSPVRDPPQDLADAWTPLAHEDRDWLRANLLRLGRSVRVRRAVAAGLNTSMLVELLGLWWTHAQTQSAAAIVREAVARLDEAQDPSRTEARRRMLWETTLAYLLVGAGAGRFSEDDFRALVWRELDRWSASADGTSSARARQRDEDALLRSLHRHESVSSAGSRELRAVLARLMSTPSHRLRSSVARALESPRAAERLLDLLPTEEVQRVLQWLRPDVHATAVQCVVQATEACAAVSRDTPAAALARPAWRVVMREYFEEDRPLQPAGLLRRLVDAFERFIRPAVPAAWRDALSRVLGTHRGPAGTALAITEPEPPAPVLLGPAPVVADAGEPIFIGNAGLVLAGPYLPRLFTLLQLADARAFKDEASAHRAVLLLQYVATGALEMPEPLLVLNKLMCGLRLDAAVSAGFEPSQAERDAVDGMLRAMIDHWKIIGKTSVAGLRESFLQREGRLEKQDDAWQLRVEPRPYDMLIDQLPWGYATLKYPWMEGVVHVDWR